MFDGDDWRRARPANSPPPRYYPALAYDVLRDRVVLFGGELQSGGKTNHTWEFDGVDWTRIPTPNAPRDHRVARAVGFSWLSSSRSG